MKRFILLALPLCGSIGCTTKSDMQTAAPTVNVTAGDQKVSDAGKEEIVNHINAAEKLMRELEQKTHGADSEVSKSAKKNWILEFNHWYKYQKELVSVNEKLGIKDSPSVLAGAERTELEDKIVATAAVVLNLNQKMAIASRAEQADLKLSTVYNEKRIQYWQYKLEGILP